MITFGLKCCPLCKRLYHSSVRVCVPDWACLSALSNLRPATPKWLLPWKMLIPSQRWRVASLRWGLRWPMWHIDVRLHHHREATDGTCALTWWQRCCLVAISLPLRVRRGAQLEEVMCSIKFCRLYKGRGQHIRIRLTSVLLALLFFFSFTFFL